MTTPDNTQPANLEPLIAAAEEFERLLNEAQDVIEVAVVETGFFYVGEVNPKPKRYRIELTERRQVYP